jgi:hypothetical protein
MRVQVELTGLQVQTMGVSQPLDGAQLLSLSKTENGKMVNLEHCKIPCALLQL